MCFEVKRFAPSLPWLARVFPSALVRPGPAGLDVWQWIALPAAALIAFALGLIRQDILLRFMEVVESAGTFAFPTQTLHVYEETRDASDC